jgi:hypothetical protein
MPGIFPSEEWLKSLESKLNSDERYGRYDESRRARHQQPHGLDARQ